MNILISWIIGCMAFCLVVRLYLPIKKQMHYTAIEHLLVVISSPLWFLYYFFSLKNNLLDFTLYLLSGKPFIKHRQIVLENDVYELFKINYQELVIIKNQVCRLVDVCEITTDIEVYYEFEYILQNGTHVQVDSNVPFITLKGKISDDEYAMLDTLLPTK